MKDYTLTTLEREVFAEMARLNNTEPEMIYKTCIHSDRMYCFHYFADKLRPPLVDISPLARLEGLTQVALYQCDLQDLSPLAKIPTLEGIYISGGSELLPCDFTPLKRLTGFSLRYNRCPPSKAGNTFWASSGKSWASKRWGSPPGRSRPPLRRSGNGWRSWASPLGLP